MASKFAPISVVIPGLNEDKNIINCLDSLLNQNVKPKQIIFVNNNSIDDTLKIANSYKTKFKERNINYVVVTEIKRGVANARNAGWSIATQPIIASTDSDCRPAKNWIDSIDKFFNSNDVIACAGKIVHYDSPKFLKSVTKNGYYKIFYQLMNFVNNFYPLSTANCAVKKSAYIEVGGFDSNIISINGLDDIDIASKLTFIGKIKYNNEMIVHSSFRRFNSINKLTISLIKRSLSLLKIKNNFQKKKFKLLLSKVFKQ